jgi:hypothetical protein
MVIIAQNLKKRERRTFFWKQRKGRRFRFSCPYKHKKEGQRVPSLHLMPITADK